MVKTVEVTSIRIRSLSDKDREMLSELNNLNNNAKYDGSNAENIIWAGHNYLLQKKEINSLKKKINSLEKELSATKNILIDTKVHVKELISHSKKQITKEEKSKEALEKILTKIKGVKSN